MEHNGDLLRRLRRAPVAGKSKSRKAGLLLPLPRKPLVAGPDDMVHLRP